MTDEGPGAQDQRHAPESQPPGVRMPAALRVAVALLFAQTAVVALIVVYLVYADFTTRALVWRNALIVTGFALMVAVVLGVVGWALVRRKAWARGPAVVLELMLLPVGWFMVSAGVVWLGVPVFALGLVGAGLLITPATREALGLR